jgi:hypothetical protein
MAKGVTKNFTYSKGGGQIGATQRGEVPAEVVPVVESPVEATTLTTDGKTTIDYPTLKPGEAIVTEGDPVETQIEPHQEGTDAS